ncbi:hypothetical protein Tco_0317394 [Tanacetum coccineum]
MAGNGTNPTMKEFTANDQANYYLGITSIKVNRKNAYELKGKFLDDLHNNAFSGTNGEDAVEHIKYFLRIVDPIDLPNVNQDKLRVFFPISLVGDAWKWFDEIKGSINRSDETEPTNEKFPNLMKECWNDEVETAKIFKIETNICNYESPLCMAFNEFNYLFKVDPELFTYDIERTENYDDYMNKFNDKFEEPWDEDGVPYEIRDHICEPFLFKNGRTKWPTCNSNEDGFRNGGELPGMVRVDYMTYFQDHEWYNDLMDGSLKDEKTFGNFHELDYGLLEKLQDYWWKLNEHECSPFANWRNYIRGPYANYYSNFLDEMEHDDEERSKVFDDHERPVCNTRRFEMIKYSFRDDEEYVAIKEN